MTSATEALRERKRAREFAQESKRAKTSHPHPPPFTPDPKPPTAQTTNTIPTKRSGNDMTHGNGKRNKSSLERRRLAELAFLNCQDKMSKERKLLPTTSFPGAPAPRDHRGRKLGGRDHGTQEHSVGEMELDSNNQLSKLPEDLRNRILAMAGTGAVGDEKEVQDDVSDVCDSLGNTFIDNIKGNAMDMDTDTEDDFQVVWDRNGNFTRRTIREAAVPKVKVAKPAAPVQKEVKLDSAPTQPFRFLDLPRSIRDRIYNFALPVGSQLVPLMKREFARYPITTKIDPAYALMQACRRIHSEIEELLVRNSIAYVPIVPGRTYDESNLKIAHDAQYEGEGFITAFRGLQDFPKTYFRVHCDAPFIGDRLTKAVQLYAANSAKISAALGERRIAVVHLDEYYMWLSNNCGPAKTVSLIRTMASDKHTNWTFVWTMNTDTLFSVQHLFRDLIWLKKEVQKINGEHGNIELKVEVYGRHEPFGEEIMEELTREIIPGSMLWTVRDS
ncbi:hypothetical protein BDV96DRAFT_676030, partial [Lophiotrema nucula]